LLLVSATAIPVLGAGFFSVTVPGAGDPPGSVETLRELRAGAFTVIAVFCVVPLSVAEIVTAVLLATGYVVAVKVVELAPAATVTLEGTVTAAVLPLLSVTTAPPPGAGPFSVTVPGAGVPPGSVETLRDFTAAAFTVNVALWVPVFNVAEIVTGVLLATGVVVTVKVAVVAPAATVTLDGTVAAAVLLLLSVTTSPPVGAGPLNVTVPVDEVPPVTVAGFKLTVLGTGAETVKLALCVVLL